MLIKQSLNSVKSISTPLVIRRNFIQSSISRKTLTDSVIDSVKSTAQTVNRVAGNAALKGIDGAETVRDAASNVVKNAGPLTDKAKDLAGDAQTKVNNLGNDTLNKAENLSTDANATASKVASNISNEGQKLANQVSNEADKANR